MLNIRCTFRLRFSSSNSHFGRFVSSFSILQHENKILLEDNSHFQYKLISCGHLTYNTNMHESSKRLNDYPHQSDFSKYHSFKRYACTYTRARTLSNIYACWKISFPSTALSWPRRAVGILLKTKRS